MELNDTTDAGTYQASLAFRGTDEQPALHLDENFFYNWKCVGSLRGQGHAQAGEDGDIHEHTTGAVLHTAH